MSKGGEIFEKTEFTPSLQLGTGEYSLRSVSKFKIQNDCPKISDHYPITIVIDTEYKNSMDVVMKAAKEINRNVSNHSTVPIINKVNTDLMLLNNLLRQEVAKLNNIEQYTSTDIADFLYNNIHKYGKISQKKQRRNKIYEEPNEEIGTNTCNTYHKLLENKESKKWDCINNCNDSK